MEVLRNMFSPKSSMAASKFNNSPKKRTYDSSSEEETPVSSKKSKNDTRVKDEEPRFTFDEVKSMIERLLTHRKNSTSASTACLKHVDFDDVAIPGHSVQGCKDLLEQLIKGTRRTRTLHEVLNDIKSNLNKRVYTEIIQRASIDGEAPKRPPSAYLLFHQDRYNELKHENPLAAEVSKMVSQEWKSLSEKQRRSYQNKHNELMEKYRQNMTRLGLIDQAAPKRPKSAKLSYVNYKLKKLKINPANHEKIAEAKERLGREFDQLPEHEKKQWINQHKAEKEMFQQQREEYVAAHPHLNHAQIDKPRTREPKVSPPQPPLSALKFFYRKKMPEGLEGQEYEETKKRLKEKFLSLSEKKLLRFIKKAVKDKERYDQELAEFKVAHPNYDVPKLKPSISKDQWKLYSIRIENRPILPAPTAYLHYCGKLLTDMHDDELDHQAPTKRMQAASASWKDLSEDDKQVIEQEHREAISHYIEAMEDWLSGRTEDRRQKVLNEDPKSNPDYWRKKLNRLAKAETKKNRN